MLEYLLIFFMEIYNCFLREPFPRKHSRKILVDSFENSLDVIVINVSLENLSQQYIQQNYFLTVLKIV